MSAMVTNRSGIPNKAKHIQAIRPNFVAGTRFP